MSDELNLDRLERLATAATPQERTAGMLSEDALQFIEAASPSAILALLDRLRTAEAGMQCAIDEVGELRISLAAWKKRHDDLVDQVRELEIERDGLVARVRELEAERKEALSLKEQTVEATESELARLHALAANEQARGDAYGRLLIGEVTRREAEPKGTVRLTLEELKTLRNNQCNFPGCKNPNCQRVRELYVAKFREAAGE